MGRRDLHQAKELKERLLATLPDWCGPAGNLRIVQLLVEQWTFEGLSDTRIGIYLGRLKFIFSITPVLLSSFSEQHLKTLLLYMRQKKYSLVTMELALVTLKKASHQYPNLDFVRNAPFKRSYKKFDKYLPTEQEVHAMIRAARNLRDKAFVSVLWEGGMRPSDIMSLRLKDVVFDQYGCVLKPDGKTNDYSVRLVDASHHLSAYLEHIRDYLQQDTYIWLNLAGSKAYQPAPLATMTKAVKLLARAAGIKEQVCLYSFRHAHQTDMMRKGYSHQLINRHHGRKANSKQIEVYEHLTAADVGDMYLERRGIIQNKEHEHKPKQCPRCQYINPMEAKFCNKCGLVLDLKTAEEVQKEQSRPDELMNELLKDPEVKALLLKKMKSLQP